MNQAHGAMVNRKNYLEQLLKKTETAQKQVPPGKLRIRNDKGLPRYYQILDPKDTIGIYLSKEQQVLAEELAKKDYLQKIRQTAEQELKDINKYLNRHGENDLENIYANAHEHRKALLHPLVLPDSLLGDRWQNTPYEGNPYKPEEKVYSTKREELVRSKSEVLLADMYCELGVPYRYEAPVIMKNGKKHYPDFTLLHIKTQTLYYHEHLGRMDLDNYRIRNLKKLEDYRRNGIYTGKNLVLTFEAEGSPLNIKEIRKMIKEMFL